MSESKLQQAVVKYLAYALPHSLVWHTANTARSVRQMAQFKAMGLRPGVPDLAILSPRGLHFIELKHGRNRPSAEQEEFMAEARALGADTAVCWSLDDVQNALRAWRLIK